MPVNHVVGIHCESSLTVAWFQYTMFLSSWNYLKITWNDSRTAAELEFSGQTAVEFRVSGGGPGHGHGVEFSGHVTVTVKPAGPLSGSTVVP